MQLLNIFELANMLDVSTGTVRRWWATGILPAPLKIGRSIRWRNADIQAWLEAGCPHMANVETETEKIEV